MFISEVWKISLYISRKKREREREGETVFFLTFVIPLLFSVTFIQLPSMFGKAWASERTSSDR